MVATRPGHDDDDASTAEADDVAHSGDHPDQDDHQDRHRGHQDRRDHRQGVDHQIRPDADRRDERRQDDQGRQGALEHSPNPEVVELACRSLRPVDQEAEELAFLSRQQVAVDVKEELPEQGDRQSGSAESSLIRVLGSIRHVQADFPDLHLKSREVMDRRVPRVLLRQLERQLHHQTHLQLARQPQALVLVQVLAPLRPQAQVLVQVQELVLAQELERVPPIRQDQLVQPSHGPCRRLLH